MTDTQSRIERVMHDIKPRKVSVIAADNLTPNYRRILFGGDDLTDFVSLAPTDHIKVLISQEPGRSPVPPVKGQPSPDAPRQTMRDYTPRAFGHGTLTVDFALHGDGPLTTWARNAEPGAEAVILGPRGSKVVKPEFTAWAAIGDDTMLPAIARILETRPAGAEVIAIIEVDGPDDEIALETEANATIIWAHREGRAPGDAMLEALRSAPWPETDDIFVWAGGEATAMRDVRRVLLNERNVPRENLSLSGHWKRGDANFDHHSPIED